MKIIDLKQNTPEWLLWRANKIGSSEVPTLYLGQSPYDKRITSEVLLEKKAMDWSELVKMSKHKIPKEKILKYLKKKKPAYILDLGHKVESILRPAIELKLNQDFRPACGQHPEFSYFVASFDGINDQAIWECKLTSYDNVINCIIGQEVPTYFNLQCQWLMYVSGLSSCYLTMVSWDKQEKCIIEQVTKKINVDNEFKVELPLKMDIFYQHFERKVEEYLK